jgi:uncharacterized membrane protein
MGEHPLIGLVLEGLRREIAVNAHWMTWNTTLALAPWVLSLLLFPRTGETCRWRRTGARLTGRTAPTSPPRRPSWPWFAGLAAWLLLIPNAAYVLTDVVHLPGAVRREPSDAVVLLVVFPLYAAYFAVGFTAYADALRRLRRYVVRQGWLRHGWPAELAVHASSAVGIYLGRIHRFNSWDVARQPLPLLESLARGATRPTAVAAILLTFCVLACAQAITNPFLDRWSPVVRRSASKLRPS